jgi:hypothetical protein
VNLRILKKLSKRAAPLLPLLGDDRKQFKAEKGDSYTSVRGHDFKHWERMRSVHGDTFRGTIKYRPKHGRGWIAMMEPPHPLKGTVMVGEMVGYYEPEWEEHTAWEALHRLVIEYFTDWNEDGPIWTHKGKLDTPTRILSAACGIIAATTNTGADQ